MMKLVIVAIDSFKGCLTSREANLAAAEGILKSTPSARVVQISVSDGGEGWLEAFQSAIGGKRVEVSVYDPLMRFRVSGEGRHGSHRDSQGQWADAVVA